MPTALRPWPSHSRAPRTPLTPRGRRSCGASGPTPPGVTSRLRSSTASGAARDRPSCFPPFFGKSPTPREFGVVAGRGDGKLFWGPGRPKLP